MTKEEAIKVLEQLIPDPARGDGKGLLNLSIANALMMAIEALDMVDEFEKAQIITGGRLNGRTYAYKCGLEDGKRKALQQEPCERAISKDALLNDLYKRQYKKFTWRDFVACVQYQPSVHPKAKTGKWLHRNDDYNDWSECSECGYGDEGEVKFGEETPYCPYCGAKMESEDKECRNS